MAKINPLSKWAKEIIDGNGKKSIEINTHSNPIYYYDKTGSLNPIDVTDIQTINKDTVGEIKLREKGLSSVGFRTDGNKTKYLGIRPSETQEDGTEQVEWTIEESIINNVTQSIILNQTSSINDTTTNLGGSVIQSDTLFTRQMVTVTGSLSNFQVKYKLHLTGLEISNSKYTETTTVRSDISSSGTVNVGTNYYKPNNGLFVIKDENNRDKFSIPPPLLLDSDIEGITDDTIHTLKDNEDGTYEYIKYPSDNLLSTGFENLKNPYGITSSVSYIDATLLYQPNTYWDGMIGGGIFTGSSDADYTWDRIHDASSTAVLDISYTTLYWHTQKEIAVSSQVSSTAVSIHRSLYAFDCSSIRNETQPFSASLELETEGYHDADLIGIEATHDSASMSSGTNSTNFNDFAGWEEDWDGDNAGVAGASGSNINVYTEVIDSEDTLSGTAPNRWKMTLTQNAISDIKSNDIIKFMIMEHEYDFKDVDVGAGSTVTKRQGLNFRHGTLGGAPKIYLTFLEGGLLELRQGIMKLNSGTITIK